MFSGSAADDPGGSGLNANSTTFTLQGPDGRYWDGVSAWQGSQVALATTHSATSGGTAATWTSASGALPAWSTQSDGDGIYTVQATATDKATNPFPGTAVHFTLDSTLPTASVTAPVIDQVFIGTATSASITGTAGDTGGTGDTGVSTVAVSIQRSSDNKYFAGGTSWGLSPSWLTASTGDAWANWTYTWNFDPAFQDGSPSYTITARATDGVGNNGTSTAVTGVQVNNNAPTVKSIVPVSNPTKLTSMDFIGPSANL